VAENNMILELKEIGFAFDHHQLFSGVSFSLRAGEKIGLLGPIGCGKTTLLQMVVGLTEPVSGSVELFGQQCSSSKEFEAMLPRIGFQFQDPDDQLFCPTVLEDIAFGPLNQGKSQAEAIEIAGACLAQVGMSGKEERVIHHLSAGEKRLVSLASVLAMKPDLLLLDEPNSGLDSKAEGRIASLIRSLPQSVLMIAHNIDFLKATTDRILVFEDGELRE
jgi:cobalt/nickel transport system ATP-binding protein